MIHRIYFILLLLSLSFTAKAQLGKELIPNGGFEEYAKVTPPPSGEDDEEDEEEEPPGYFDPYQKPLYWSFNSSLFYTRIKDEMCIRDRFTYALGTSRTLRPYNEDGSLEYYRNNWAPFNIFNEYANNKMNIDVLDFKIQGEATYRLNDDIAIKTLLSTRQAYTSTTHEVHEASNIVQAFRANENPFVAQQNIYLVHDKDNPQLQPKVGLTHGGILNKTEASLKSVLARIALDFDKRMGEHRCV